MDLCTSSRGSLVGLVSLSLSTSFVLCTQVLCKSLCPLILLYSVEGGGGAEASSGSLFVFACTVRDCSFYLCVSFYITYAYY
jgi:hypothetical protein